MMKINKFKMMYLIAVMLLLNCVWAVAGKAPVTIKTNTKKPLSQIRHLEESLKWKVLNAVVRKVYAVENGLPLESVAKSVRLEYLKKQNDPASKRIVKQVNEIMKLIFAPRYLKVLNHGKTSQAGLWYFMFKYRKTSITPSIVAEEAFRLNLLKKVFAGKEKALCWSLAKPQNSIREVKPLARGDFETTSMYKLRLRKHKLNHKLKVFQEIKKAGLMDTVYYVELSNPFEQLRFNPDSSFISFEYSSPFSWEKLILVNIANSLEQPGILIPIKRSDCLFALSCLIPQAKKVKKVLGNSWKPKKVRIYCMFDSKFKVLRNIGIYFYSDEEIRAQFNVLLKKGNKAIDAKAWKEAYRLFGELENYPYDKKYVASKKSLAFWNLKFPIAKKLLKKAATEPNKRQRRILCQRALDIFQYCHYIYLNLSPKTMLEVSKLTKLAKALKDGKIKQLPKDFNQANKVKKPKPVIRKTIPKKQKQAVQVKKVKAVKPEYPADSKALNIKFVYVAPGTFMMGSNKGFPDEKPVRKVKVGKGFWIGKFEVAQKLYLKIMGNNPSHFQGATLPVEMVSWNNAVEFCKKLTAREHAAGRLAKDCAYRLPTEIEWEFAARGGVKSKGYKFSGSNKADDVAWLFHPANNSTHEVGTRKANELGIHDMSGNVYEWCSDNYGKTQNKVVRGGGWCVTPEFCRPAYRYKHAPDSSWQRVGFRIVKTKK